MAIRACAVANTGVYHQKIYCRASAVLWGFCLLSPLGDNTSGVNVIGFGKLKKNIKITILVLVNTVWVQCTKPCRTSFFLDVQYIAFFVVLNSPSSPESVNFCCWEEGGVPTMAGTWEPVGIINCCWGLPPLPCSFHSLTQGITRPDQSKLNITKYTHLFNSN